MPNVAGFAATIAGTSAVPFTPPGTVSPAQVEKDTAVSIARRVLLNNSGVTRDEASVLARQFLRALALPA